MIDWNLLFPLITLGLCFVGLSWFAGSDAPFVATSMTQVPKVLKKAGVKKGKLFYELGSGDGRVVFAAAKLKAAAFGVEQSWLRVLYCRFQAKQLQLKNAQFYHGNIFDRNYFPADIIYIYLLTPGVKKLESKLKTELKPGAKVITQRYHFPTWKPSQKLGDFWIYTA